MNSDMGAMAITALFTALIYLALGILNGFALTVEYLSLRCRRAPLPSWVSYLRAGWHVIFGSVAVYQTLTWDWLLWPAILIPFTSFGFFIAAAHCKTRSTAPRI